MTIAKELRGASEPSFGRSPLIKTLYVSDLDGTLLNSDVRVSDNSARIINALVGQGMRFTYATARAFETARKVTDGLRLDLPVIVYNGAFILSGSGEALHSCFFSDDEADYINALLVERGINPLVYSFIGGTDRVSWDTAHETEGIREYLASRSGDRRLRPVSGGGELYGGDIFYYLCIGGEGELDGLYELLRGDDRYYCTFQRDLYLHDYYWLEIMPRGATKANAVKRLRDMLGCDRIVTFGDAVNDLPMFKASDEAYAMANAIPELKAAATAVIGGNDDDGVAIWLEQSFCAESGRNMR